MLVTFNMIFEGVQGAERSQSRSSGEYLQHHRPIFGHLAEMMIQWIIKGDDRAQRMGMPQKWIKIIDNFWLDRVLVSQPLEKPLNNRVAIVTGGARGIGLSICELFADKGATVIMMDVLEEGGNRAEEIRTKGRKAFFQHVDVTNGPAILEAVENVVQTHHAVDVLINNAGITRDRTFLKMTDEEWTEVIQVNLYGTYHACKAVVPHMKERGYGRIISASSINGKIGAFGQTNYSASKAALIGFTKSLAKELGKYGITVNSILPGFVDTEMTRQMPAALRESHVQQIPVGRMGTPLDIAHACLFLASEHAGFISGTALDINGGVY